MDFETKYYYLKDKQLCVADTIEEYMEAAEHLDREEMRRVAETTLDDRTWISTVCVMIDMAWYDETPLVFETMTFPSRDNLSETGCERYSTYEDALAGHERMVENEKKRLANG